MFVESEKANHPVARMCRVPEVPKLIVKIYKMPAPATPRDDLVSVFLTGVEGINKPANVTPSEQLRLNMSIAPTAKEDRMGVVGGDKAGFPNGRRLGDDVVDISLQVLEGELIGTPNDLGDGVDKNDVKSTDAFPTSGCPTPARRTAVPRCSGRRAHAAALLLAASPPAAAGRQATAARCRGCP